MSVSVSTASFHPAFWGDRGSNPSLADVRRRISAAQDDVFKLEALGFVPVVALVGASEQCRCRRCGLLDRAADDFEASGVPVIGMGDALHDFVLDVGVKLDGNHRPLRVPGAFGVQGPFADVLH